ncbi:hypothetical protein BH11BAC3_BH11BAC3_38780 [soil metagenome]
MKTFFFSSFVLLFGGSASSQVSYGIKSGINIASTKDLISFPKNKLGWYAGGLAKISLNKILFLEPELLYSSKGTGASKQVGPLKIVTRFNYLNAPILVGYKIHKTTSILFGPEFGYLIAARTIYGSSGSFNTSKNYPYKFDFGLALGLDFNILPNTIVEFRYDYGFKTLYYVDDYGVRNGQNRGANWVFQIGINYIFIK